MELGKHYYHCFLVIKNNPTILQQEWGKGLWYSHKNDAKLIIIYILCSTVIHSVYMLVYLKKLNNLVYIRNVSCVYIT